VTPLRYRLHLAPDPVAGTFAGDLTLDFAIDAGTEAITLDCLDLDIEAAWVDGAPAAWCLDGDKLVVTPQGLLTATANVRVTYAGRLRAQSQKEAPVAPGFDPFAKAPNRRQRLELKAMLADTPAALRGLAAEIAAIRAEVK